MRPERQPHLNKQGKHDAQKEGSMDRKQFLKTGLVAAFATAAMADRDAPSPIPRTTTTPAKRDSTKPSTSSSSAAASQRRWPP